MRKGLLARAVAMGILLSTVLTMNAQEKESLKLVETIPMPNVKGRIDHMDVDVKGERLFVSGLENGSVEVINLQSSKWTRSISGFQKPQGIACVPSLNKVFVASGDDGMLRVFRGDTFELLDSIKLDIGPNRVAYDARKKLLYVGYGGKDAGKDYGEVGIIDARTDKKLYDVQVAAHPSEMLLDKAGRTLFVFLSIAGEIQVIDTRNRKVTATWPVYPRSRGLTACISTRRASEFTFREAEGPKSVMSTHISKLTQTVMRSRARFPQDPEPERRSGLRNWIAIT